MEKLHSAGNTEVSQKAIRRHRYAHLTKIMVVSLIISASLGIGQLYSAHEYSTALDTRDKTNVADSSTKVSKGFGDAANSFSENSQSVARPSSVPAATGRPVEDNQSVACGILTLTVARQILGASAKTDAEGTLKESTTPDVATSVCSHSIVTASGKKSLQLVARLARTSLGVSANAMPFGSERPGGVQTVQGYGQSSYWDPAKSEFQILNNNNWYTLTSVPASNDFSSVEPTATLIVKGLK